MDVAFHNAMGVFIHIYHCSRRLSQWSFAVPILTEFMELFGPRPGPGSMNVIISKLNEQMETTFSNYGLHSYIAIVNDDWAEACGSRLGLAFQEDDEGEAWLNSFTGFCRQGYKPLKNQVTTAFKLALW